MLSESAASVIFIALGILSLLAFVWTIYRQSRVRYWRSTIGEIIESHVEKDADLNTFAVIKYRYSAGGKERTGDRIYPHGSVATTGSLAASMVARHPIGSKVRVLFNPDNPEDTALQKSLPIWVPILQLAAGILFILFGANFDR